jgi:hypothetical protein
VLLLQDISGGSVGKTYESTNVPGGESWCISSYMIDATTSAL